MGLLLRGPNKTGTGTLALQMHAVFLPRTGSRSPSLGRYSFQNHPKLQDRQPFHKCLGGDLPPPSLGSSDWGRRPERKSVIVAKCYAGRDLAFCREYNRGVSKRAKAFRHVWRELIVVQPSNAATTNRRDPVSARRGGEAG